MGPLEAEWQTNVAYEAKLPDKVIDWPTALSYMLEKNLKLRAARIDVTNAQEQVRQIFRDLVPTINMRAGLTKSIRSLGATSLDDVTLSADSFFNIPGIVNFGARLYSARLYQLRAETAYRLAEREQTIELYRLFYGAEETSDEQKRLESQRATAQAMQQIDPFTGRLMVTEMESRELGQKRDWKGLQDRASEILGTHQYRWIFATNGLPNLHYQDSPLPLSDTNRVAQLQLKLLAVELEAARAMLFGLKLRYWPELNIFVSSPAIYERNAGRSRWWDARNVQASADLFWQIDTRGYISRLIKQTKRLQDLQRDRMRQENIALIDRLIFTQQLIQSVQQQLERVDKQLQLLLAIPPAQNYFAIQKYALDYRSLTQQQLRLKRDLSELNAVFWFVDEDAWKEQMTAAPPPLRWN